MLIVGVNGAGKTTTVGKIAYKYGKEGAKVSLGWSGRSRRGGGGGRRSSSEGGLGRAGGGCGATGWVRQAVVKGAARQVVVGPVSGCCTGVMVGSSVGSSDVS